MENLTQTAEQYLDAYSKKLWTEALAARQDVIDTKALAVGQDVIDTKFAGFGGQRDNMRCFACDGIGHRAANCTSKASTSQNELTGHFHQSYCYKCRLTGRDTKNCRNVMLCSQPNNNQMDKILVAARLGLGKSHLHCKFYGGLRRRKLKLRWILGVEVKEKDQSGFTRWLGYIIFSSPFQIRFNKIYEGQGNSLQPLQRHFGFDLQKLLIPKIKQHSYCSVWY